MQSAWRAEDEEDEESLTEGSRTRNCILLANRITRLHWNIVFCKKCMRISLNVLRNAPTKRAGLTDRHGQSTRRAISPGKRDREGEREGGKITRTKHIPLHDHIRRKAGWQALRMPGYPSISAIVGWLWTRSNTLLSPVRVGGWTNGLLQGMDGRWVVVCGQLELMQVSRGLF